MKLGNTEIEAIATPGHAPRTTPTSSPITRRGDEPWLVLTGDALLVGDAGRPDLHAHGEHTRRGDGADAVPLADRAAARAARPPAALPVALLRLGLRARPVGATRSRRIGFERRHNAALQFSSEDEFVAALTKDIPPAPEQQAAIVAANRSGRPRRQRLRSSDAPGRSELGLRENLAQFSLLVAVNAFVGAMVGLERSTLPLIGREDFDLASNAAVLSFIVAFGLVKALTNLGAGALARARRSPAAADRRLGGGAAGPAADRGRRRAGAGSSPPTSCSASTRAWPGR